MALLLATGFTVAAPPAGEAGRAAATTFGAALTAGSAAALRPILPERGRVHLALSRLGPEEGLFGAQQVEALFREFLAHGTMSSFQLIRFESEPGRGAVAHGTAAIVDREGHRVPVGLH